MNIQVHIMTKKHRQGSDATKSIIFRSPIAKAIYEVARGMYRLNLLSEKAMHAFDDRCIASNNTATPSSRHTNVKQ